MGQTTSIERFDSPKIKMDFWDYVLHIEVPELFGPLPKRPPPRYVRHIRYKFRSMMEQ
jgi:hypothetical protein